MYSPFYFLGQTFKNMFRSKGMSFASILVLTACLLVTGTFYAVNENVNYNLSGLGQLNRILAYVSEEQTDDAIRRIKEEVEALPNVQSVRVISKQEALEDEKDRLGEEYAEIFNWLQEGENPYRASLEIEYEQPEGVQELETAIGKIEGVESVQSRTETAQKVAKIKDAVSKIFWIMMVLLFVVSLFIIITTIRLAMSARSKEISVMRYVGASGFFIAVPFLLEGLIIGAVAAGVALGCQQYIYTLVTSGAGQQFFGFITFLPASAMTKELAVGFFGIGLFTGLFGSIVSIARHIGD